MRQWGGTEDSDQIACTESAVQIGIPVVGSQNLEDHLVTIFRIHQTIAGQIEAQVRIERLHLLKQQANVGRVDRTISVEVSRQSLKVHTARSRIGGGPRVRGVPKACCTAALQGLSGTIGLRRPGFPVVIDDFIFLHARQFPGLAN